MDETSLQEEAGLPQHKTSSGKQEPTRLSCYSNYNQRLQNIQEEVLFSQQNTSPRKQKPIRQPCYWKQ